MMTAHAGTKIENITLTLATGASTLKLTARLEILISAVENPIGKKLHFMCTAMNQT